MTAHDLDGETFVAMAARIGVAESTVRGWRDAGIRRLRVSMSEMPGRHVSKEQR